MISEESPKDIDPFNIALLIRRLELDKVGEIKEWSESE